MPQKFKVWAGFAQEHTACLYMLVERKESVTAGMFGALLSLHIEDIFCMEGKNSLVFEIAFYIFVH